MSEFIKTLTKTYKSILLEQPVPGYGEPAAGAQSMPDMGAVGAASPVPPMPTAGGSTPPEQPVETKETRSSSDAFLIGMIAKALLVNIDDNDKLKVVKYLKGLDKKSASAVEENLVHMINQYDYQNIDEDPSDEFKIPPKRSRKVLKFLNKIMREYVDELDIDADSN
jgi:hypothetical protein